MNFVSVFEEFIIILLLVTSLFTHSMQSRKLQEHGWKPRWFHREGENGSFRYVGGYWEARERGNWDGCPNIFGEFNEDLVESSEGS